MSWDQVLCGVMGICICSITIFGQTANTVVGAGYTLPTPITVAPGQVITLFVQGVGNNLTRPVRADRLPLPTTLTGISVSMQQLYGPPGDIPLPLFSVERFETCVPPSTECGKFTAVTVEIPVELAPNIPLTGRPPNIAQLVVSENGVRGGAASLNPMTDSINVLRSCGTLGAFSPDCNASIVTHADGSLVTASNPAKSGEVLVMYALGLGLTNPIVKSGEPTPVPAPITSALIGFDLRPNAPPMRPRPRVPMGGPIPQPGLLFVGLVPGLVGLYQINFLVPNVPSQTPRCEGEVRSNLTVSIGKDRSFDGAGICVEVPDRAATVHGAENDSSNALGPSQPKATGSFVPNTIRFPLGSDLRHLGRPLPSNTGATPPGRRIVVLGSRRRRGNSAE